MTLASAIDQVQRDFPFRGYTQSQVDAYRNIARTVLRNLPAGSSILDFGCGSCDKDAVLQILGYRCTGYDDLGDEWHRMNGNMEKILDFTKSAGVDLRIATGAPLPFTRESFDMVMMHDVLEHLHDSPRELVNDLLELLKPGGLFFATVPNAVNLRKRLDVIRGTTNLPRFEGYYWTPGSWRGHVREYTRGDLQSLAEYLGLEIVELKGCHHMLHRVPPALRWAYTGLTGVLTGLKDSWSLVARKGPGWAARRNLPREELKSILQKSTSYQYR